MLHRTFPEDAEIGDLGDYRFIGCSEVIEFQAIERQMNRRFLRFGSLQPSSLAALLETVNESVFIFGSVTEARRTDCGRSERSVLDA